MHSLMQFGGIDPLGSSRIEGTVLTRSETQHLKAIVRLKPNKQGEFVVLINAIKMQLRK